MNILVRSDKIEIRTCDKRYGVFANDFIPQGMVLEEAVAIVFPDKIFKTEQYLKELNKMRKKLGNVPSIPDYWFEFPRLGVKCLPSGVLFVCNHSHKPNSRWKLDTNKHLVTLFAIQDINKDEEVTHDYGGAAPKLNHFINEDNNKVDPDSIRVLMKKNQHRN